MRFATRLNSSAVRPKLFWPEGSTKPDTLDLLQRVASVEGLTEVDPNYPDHLVNGSGKSTLIKIIAGVQPPDLGGVLLSKGAPIGI